MTESKPDDGKAAEADDPPAGGKSGAGKSGAGKSQGSKPENSAPDAVKDPSEKTGGHPGGQPQGDETDPGSG